MDKPAKHILVCASFRANGTPQGFCHKKGSTQLLGYLQEELANRGMNGITVSATGCLNACDRGPIMVVHPDNTWYGGVEGEDDIDAILDAIEAGKVADGYELN